MNTLCSIMVILLFKKCFSFSFIFIFFGKNYLKRRTRQFSKDLQKEIIRKQDQRKYRIDEVKNKKGKIRLRMKK